MKESKTTYSYLIEHMQHPSFQKIWDNAFDFVKKLPAELSDELHESLNRGVDVLDSEPVLQMYIYAFGKMHNAKLQYAFSNMNERVINNKQIEIIDYGCGQGLASICYHDFIMEHNPDQQISRITLIEPSSLALSRAELLCSCFYPNTEIIAINKTFDNLTSDNIKFSSDVPTLHLLSNILDVDSYNLNHLIEIVKEISGKNNEYIIVSPIQNATRIQRLKTFASNIGCSLYYEKYMDKRQLDKERDWTCAVLLCTNTTQQEIIESDCEKILEETKAILDNKKQDLNSTCCKELLSKLQVCAELGNKRCQNMLGIWHEVGIGTEKNYQKALEWYQKAAEQGYSAALGNIGNLYCFGEGVEKDYDIAFRYYKMAAEQNNETAINNIASCYYRGYGVGKNIEHAIKLYTEAAMMGNVMAINSIITLFEKREGIEYFGDEQYDVFILAAQKGIISISTITRYWSNLENSRFEDSDGVQYSNDGRRLLCTNMYFNPDK